MPVASIYDYFPTKEDIAYAVRLVQMGEHFTEFARGASSIDTARERLRLFILLTADFVRRHPHWARTLYLEVWPSVMVGRSRVRQSLEYYGRIMVALIQDGERSGGLAADPDPCQTTIFIESSSQLIITWLLCKRPRNLMKVVGPLAERLMSLLLPAPSGAAGRKRTRGLR